MAASASRGPRLAAINAARSVEPSTPEEPIFTETVDLVLVSLAARVGLERTTFEVDMLSPVLRALQPGEHLRVSIGFNPERARLEVALGGRFVSATATDLASRTDHLTKLLSNISLVQLPGFRSRVRRGLLPPLHSRAITPRGRPLPMAIVPGKALGPQMVKAANDDVLLLPPLGLAPERLMAAAQILASQNRALKMTLQLRLVPLIAATQKRIEEARAVTEDQDAQSHLAAIRQAADVAEPHQYLSHLLLDGGGLEVRLVAEADTPIDDTLAAMLSYAVFGTEFATSPAMQASQGLDALYPTRLALPAIVTGLALTAAFSFQRPQREYTAAIGPGMHLGDTRDAEPVRIAEADRAQHILAIGSTGTGKSTMLANQIIADMQAGKGLILVDPHGDLWDAVLANVPEQRRGDLITGRLGDPAHAFTMNILEGLGGDPQIERTATINGLLRLFKNTFWAGVDAFGPIFDTYFRNAMLLLLEGRGEDASILEFERVFQDEEFRDGLLEKCESQAVKDFWQKTVADMTYKDWSLENLNVYITSKLSPFLANPLLRPVLGATRSSLDVPAAIASGKIVLLNLSKGIVGDGSARLIGGLVTMRLIAAVQTQGKLPEAQRKPFVAYLDEFQTYATEHIAEAMAEVRKYKLSMVLACQSLSQVDGRGAQADVGSAVVANVANLVSFRVGVEDAAVLSRWFAPDFSAEDLMYLSNHRAVARLLVNGEALRPVEFQALPPVGVPAAT